MEVIVQFAFVEELRMISVGGLKFDGYLEICLGIDALIDLSECAFIELADDFVVFADLFGYLGHAEECV